LHLGIFEQPKINTFSNLLIPSEAFY